MSTEYSKEELQMAMSVIYKRDYSVLNPNTLKVLDILIGSCYKESEDFIVKELSNILSEYDIWYTFYAYRKLVCARIKYNPNLSFSKIKSLLLNPKTLYIAECLQKMMPP